MPEAVRAIRAEIASGQSALDAASRDLVERAMRQGWPVMRVARSFSQILNSPVGVLPHLPDEIKVCIKSVLP